VSQAQWVGRDRIRRLIGEPAHPTSLFATQPYRSHGSLSCKGGSTKAATIHSIVKTRPGLKWFTKKSSREARNMEDAGSPEIIPSPFRRRHGRGESRRLGQRWANKDFHMAWSAAGQRLTIPADNALRGFVCPLVSEGGAMFSDERNSVGAMPAVRPGPRAARTHVRH